MTISRRSFLASSTAVAVGAIGLSSPLLMKPRSEGW
ncbi:MAG: twin-arginine translocation signal domain-containing protein, partial [Geminicoccaceae bacterium]